MRRWFATRSRSAGSRAATGPGPTWDSCFACVGRFYPQEKGQDLLIRVLAREKWRSRPVSVTFFGSGQHGVGLAEMADFHGLENVRFGGFTHDIEEIWASHHALVLPSRAEGLPLVLVEAMLSGRVAIVTDVAGNGEVLEDDVSGFLASAPTEDALDEAMERAWQRRAEWRDIGERAAADIRRLVPPDPAGALAMQLISAGRRAIMRSHRRGGRLAPGRGWRGRRPRAECRSEATCAPPPSLMPRSAMTAASRGLLAASPGSPPWRSRPGRMGSARRRGCCRWRRSSASSQRCRPRRALPGTG